MKLELMTDDEFLEWYADNGDEDISWQDAYILIRSYEKVSMGKFITQETAGAFPSFPKSITMQKNSISIEWKD